MKVIRHILLKKKKLYANVLLALNVKPADYIIPTH